MSNKFLIMISLSLFALTLSACQSKPKPHVDKSVEYKDARSIPSLKLPGRND